MYVWVKEEKAFYYLKDIVDDINNPGATVSDWEQASGGGKTVIIKEKSTEPAKPAAPVKKKDGDEFKEEAPKW
jgi:hypothetical protein